MTYKTIGIVGGGTIGQAVFDYLAARDSLSVEYVLVSDAKRGKRQGAIANVLTDDVEGALNRKVDLVIEAANASFLIAHAPRILSTSSLCGFSCTALADAVTQKAVEEAAAISGRKFYLPHGGIFGLDGLMDGRDSIESVTITTIKSGSSLGRAADLEGVIFDGPTREACREFPRNVNVHAAIAFAGIGFDRTRSIVIAEPGTTTMAHRIKVTGKSLDWDIAVRSGSLGGVTGSYTPRSAVGSVARILGAGVIANV